MSEPVATLENVSYRYPGATEDALSGESWSIAAGSLSLLVGASGSGKSSLLRCLNGLIPHFSGGSFGGAVTVGGIDTRVAGPRELSRIAGFVFQDPEAQMITDRVDDEIAFSLEQHGMARQAMRRRVDWAMRVVGIEHLAERRPSELSGGERQRVAIASALALQPRLLVLDEPTSQLDPEGAASIVAAIESAARDAGLAVIVAEHRLEHLLGIADVLKSMTAPRLWGDPATVAAAMDPTPLPPVARLARALNRPDAPLTLDAARTHFDDLALPPAPGLESWGVGGVLTSGDGVEVVMGRQRALRNISLDVHEGELVALMGRNGSGKTTLLRAIAGLQPLRSGTVHTLGHDMRRTHPAELGGRVGYMPQQASTLFSRERLIDELVSTARCRDYSLDPTATLDRLGLAHMASRHPLDLSGGERERAALATVLHGGPRLLLLDEPTRGMDAWRKIELAALLKEVRGTGAGIVLATHDTELVARCATRVAILDRGELVADGHPRQVLPRSEATKTQVNALFRDTWLTVEDVLRAIGTTERM